MKKFILYLFFIFLVSACGAARDGFSLKKNNSDEFLVEKKNPLVMPPDYDQLPLPEDFKSKSTNSENQVEDEIENIIKKSENKSIENSIKKTDIGKSVLEKIN